MALICGAAGSTSFVFLHDSQLPSVVETGDTGCDGALHGERPDIRKPAAEPLGCTQDGTIARAPVQVDTFLELPLRHGHPVWRLDLPHETEISLVASLHENRFEA